MIGHSHYATFAPVLSRREVDALGRHVEALHVETIQDVETRLEFLAITIDHIVSQARSQRLDRVRNWNKDN